MGTTANYKRSSRPGRVYAPMKRLAKPSRLASKTIVLLFVASLVVCLVFVLTH